MTTFSVFYERREREEIVLQFDDESWFFWSMKLVSSFNYIYMAFKIEIGSQFFVFTIRAS